MIAEDLMASIVRPIQICWPGLFPNIMQVYSILPAFDIWCLAAEQPKLHLVPSFQALDSGFQEQRVGNVFDI